MMQPPPARTPEGPAPLAPRSVPALDWALLLIGLATLVASLFDFYHYSSNFAGSRGFSAWHDIAGAGFFGWFGVLLPILGSVGLAFTLFGRGIRLFMDPRLICLYGWGAGLVCEVLGIVLHPMFYDHTYTNGYHARLGHGPSFWIVLVLTLAGTGIALMRAQQVGTVLPTPLRNLPKLAR